MVSTVPASPGTGFAPPPTGARPGGSGGRRAAYARLGLLLVAALSATLSTWGIDRSRYHVFYAAAVRSMTLGPRAFLYGSFDPGDAITIDKLPGFLWPQALSAMVFGMRPWALVLPQALECVAAVIVVHRMVRRWAGETAALTAAAVLALTPVTVGLGRSIVEDAPFMLLLLLAADAAQRAAATARLRTLLLSALWVGLAFQCKMVEAWAILPALTAGYLAGAPAPLRRRIRDAALACAVAVLVSLSWVVAVSLTPAGDRPYIDGTTNDSAFSMVFGYNFLNRFGAVGLSAEGSGSVTATQHGGLGALAKMFAPGLASQGGWLYPLAALGLVWGLGAAWRRAPRTDPARTGLIVCGLWLLTYFAAFSAGSVAGHTYYLGAVAAPLAVLTGVAVGRGRRATSSAGRHAWLLPAVAAVTVLWGAIVSWRYRSFLPWVAPSAVVLCAVSLVLLRAARSRRLRTAGVALVVVSALLAPAAWSVSALDPRYNLPGGMARVGPTSPRGAGGAATLTSSQRGLLAYLRAHRDGARYLAAVPAWTDASPYILAAGAPVLPMGGFTGQVPFPTVGAFRRLVAAGEVRYVIVHPVSPPASAPGRVMAWVAAHCAPVPGRAVGGQPLYRC